MSIETSEKMIIETYARKLHVRRGRGKQSMEISDIEIAMNILFWKGNRRIDMIGEHFSMP